MYLRKTTQHVNDHSTYLAILNNMAVPIEEKGGAYVQSAPSSPASPSIPSANYQSLAGALIPTAQIVWLCSL